MDDPPNYGSLQNPDGGYNKQGQTDAGYGPYQNPSTNYANSGQPPVSTLVSGLGNGVNLQPSYYSGGNVDLGWSLMRQNSKIKSVRIEIEPDQVDNGNAQRWIKEAIANGYSVIATYHRKDALGSKDPNDLLKAASWWSTNYNKLQPSGPFLINLMNEWGGPGITAQDFASTYNQAIATVRSAYSGPIVIDIPGYGQEARIAANAIKGKTNQIIVDHKIILSAHVYPNSYSNDQGRGMTTADIDQLASTGVACMIGEFGKNNEKVQTDWLALVNYAKTKGWPVLGWAFNGDGGNMNMISPQFQPLVGGQAQKYLKTPYFDVVYACL